MLTNSRLLKMWLLAADKFLCKMEVGSEIMSWAINDETIILNGQSALCIFGKSYAHGKTPSLRKSDLRVIAEIKPLRFHLLRRIFKLL